MDSSKAKIVITGGSGFLGVNLAHALLASGFEVCIISRTPPKTNGAWKYSTWDGQSLGSWVSELDGARAIVNLAGRSVDCRKTPANCDVILRSRVVTTQLIGKAVREVKVTPPLWVQMSTAHIYGDPPEIVCSEDSPYGYGLAPFVSQAWEKAFVEAVLPSMRQVILRTSFVLGRQGGAFPKLAWLARIGLGGKVGQGTQGISWLHEVDMNRLFLRAITEESMTGVYLATAPNPVSNMEFMRVLRGVVGMPIGLPAKEWMVRLGARFVLNTDPDLALYGRYCVSKRLAEEGFEFKHPTIESAVRAIYNGR
jgi:uncharacterized protein (TIGR01777 family)